MNGAATVLERSTSAPRITMATTIGASHQRRSDVRRCQTSLTKLCWEPLARSSKFFGSSAIDPFRSGFPEVAGRVVSLAPRNPVRGGAVFDGAQTIASGESRDEGRRRDDAEVQDRQHQ